MKPNLRELNIRDRMEPQKIGNTNHQLHSTLIKASNSPTIDSVLSCRDEAESFRGFLQTSHPCGLRTFQIWLTLNGYIKEYNRYRLLYDSQLENFVRWNLKCAKALIEKFFNQSEAGGIEHEIQMGFFALNEAFRQSKKFPTVNTAEKVKSEFVTILNQAKSVMENKYFAEYQKTTKSEIQSAKKPFYSSNLSILSDLHNNSEYVSRGSSEVTTGSEFTDSTQMDFKMDKKKYRRRQKQIRKLHLVKNCLKSRLSVPCRDLSVPIRLPRLPNEAELATKNPKLFAQVITKKLQKVLEERADDSILSDHIDRVMKTPQAKAPLLMLPSITRASLRNLQKKTKLTFSNFGKSASASQLDTKVGSWLANTVSPPRQFSKSAKTSPRPAQQLYESTTFNSTFVSFPPLDAVVSNSLLSSDSGLSSSRIETESEMAESELLEMNGLKQRLIEETEGVLSTRLVYHYKGEKYMVRVPGRPPTLASFRAKMHLQGTFRFFFKNEEDFWIEITDETEPLPLVAETVEAKVIPF